MLFLYTLSGGEKLPDFPYKCSLHLPGGRVTGEGVVTGTGSLLTDSDADRKPDKEYPFNKINIHSYAVIIAIYSYVSKPYIRNVLQLKVLWISQIKILESTHKCLIVNEIQLFCIKLIATCNEFLYIMWLAICDSFH